MASSGKEADEEQHRRVTDGKIPPASPGPEVQGDDESLPTNLESTVQEEQAIAGVGKQIQQSESAVRRDPNDPSVIYLGDPSKEKINWPTETDDGQIYSYATSGSFEDVLSHNPELLEAFDETDTMKDASDEEIIQMMNSFLVKWGEDCD